MTALSRRKFLKSITAASLVVAVAPTPYVVAKDSRLSDGHITACLRIDENGEIVLCVPMPDMGQGIMTTAAQLIAEELHLDPGTVHVELMPYLGHSQADGPAEHAQFFQQIGGSESTERLWHEMRRAAAYTRELLVEAAARRWLAPKSSIRVADGFVINTDDGQRIAFGELQVDSSGFAVYKNSTDPKPLSNYAVIGQSAKNVAARDIVTGKPLFACDVDLSGLLHAVVKRCPYPNGKIASFNPSRARVAEGVVDVVELPEMRETARDRKLISAGIAVVAESFWQAKKAADLLEVEWSGPDSPEIDSGTLYDSYMDTIENGELKTDWIVGEPDQAFEQADKIVEATYFHPHWAHACMEPHSCIADVKADSAQIWVGHQSMPHAINAAANATGVPAEHIKGHFYRMGTGLGRKYEQDFLTEASLLSKTVGAPVKVHWSREDEMEQDFPNPAGAYKVRAALDSKNRLQGWNVQVVADAYPLAMAHEIPWRLIDNCKSEFADAPNNVSKGAWRGPFNNTAAWVMQSSLDEVAAETGQDRLRMLLGLFSRKNVLKSANWPNRDLDFRRFRAVLEKVATEAEFGKVMPTGWGQGIAVHHTFVSVCAHVVDLEMLGDKDYRVHKVTSAIDCGLAVNPLGVRAQVEGGIIDGLCTAKYGKWTLESGRVTSNNFDSYQKMRMDEAPAQIDVHILDMGDTEPRGTGEVALPPLIPALTNAIYAASGKRIRTLPISESL